MMTLHFDTCTSTNDVLRAEHGDMVLAVTDEQTAGRGQRGNQWHSVRGENLLFSVLLTPEALSVSDGFVLSQAMALAIYHGLATCYALDGLSIKWPNDIYVKKRKICGILIENELQGKRLCRSIVGCGINVNQTDFPKGLAVPATSVALETGHHVNRETLFSSVMQRFETLYNEICEGRYWGIREEYGRRLFMRGILARYIDANGEFYGKIERVENDGHLIIVDAAGEICRYAFKEIRIVL